MGGMFLPGFLFDLTGSYKPFLTLSLTTTSLTFSCFVFLFFAHPIGVPTEYKPLDT